MQKKLPFGLKLLLFSLGIFYFQSLDAELVCVENIGIAQDCLTPDENRIYQNLLKEQKLENLSENEFYLFFAVQLRSKGLLISAEKFFDTAIENESSKQQLNTIRLEKAVNYEWQSKLEKARNLYLEILKTEKNKFALYGLARVNAWLGDINDAVSLYNGLIDEDRMDVVAINGKAYSLYLNKQYLESYNLYLEVLEIDPNNHVAIEGISKTKNKSQHTFIYQATSVSALNESDNLGRTFSQQLSIFTEKNYHLSRNITLNYQSEPLNPNRLSPSRVDDSFDTNYKLDVNWKLKRKQKQFLYGINYKKTFSRKEEIELLFQYDLSINDKQRWFVGLKPRLQTFTNSNGLLYGGYSYNVNTRFGLQTQFFLDQVKEGENNTALVLTANQTLFNDVRAAYGYSYSDTPRGNIDSVFAKIETKLTKRFGLSLAYIELLNVSEKELQVGMRYQW